MKIRVLSPLVLVWAISFSSWAYPAVGATPTTAEASAEAKSRATYEAAVKGAQEAEAALVPLRAAMQKADAAYATAKQKANAKRQHATDTKNLSGEQGVAELKQAQEAVPAAAKALDEATAAKPGLDKALEEAKAAAQPLQQAYDAAEKAAKEAETAAKAASDAANKIDDEAKRAIAQAAAKRRAADMAKAAATRAERSAEHAAAQAKLAAEKLLDAEAQNKAAEAVAAKTRPAFDAATQAQQAAEQAALAAEAHARVYAAAEQQQAAADAAAKRKAADAAQATLVQAQKRAEQSRSWLDWLNNAPANKKAADEALASAKKRLAAATSAQQAAEQAFGAADAAAKAAAKNPAKSSADKKKLAEEATAKRRAADAAKSTLKQAQQNEQQGQSRVTAAAKTLADAPKQKKGASEGLAYNKKQVGVANSAYQPLEQAAREAEAQVKLMAEHAARSAQQQQQAAADAAAKRKAADAAKAVLAQAQAAHQNPQKLADTAAQKLARAVGQKKLAEGARDNAKAQAPVTAAALAAAEKAAAEFAKTAESAGQVAAQRAAKRKALTDAEAALAQLQQAEQQAQTRINSAAKLLNEAAGPKKQAEAALASAKNQVATATKALAEAEKALQDAQAKAKQNAASGAKPKTAQKPPDLEGRRKAIDTARASLTKARQNEKTAQPKAATAAQKAADAESQKKAAEAALADARGKMPAAQAAIQAARDAGKDVIALDDIAKQAAALAAAKRKDAVTAKATLAPVQKKLEQALAQANSGAQKVVQTETRKKQAEEALESLTKRIASAKETFAADEKAAQEAEAAAAPLKVDADKTREVYSNALKVADDRRAQVEQTKGALYRLIAAQQMASLMESPTPPKPANRIDEFVFAKLNRLGIKPLLCSDAVFIRRAYLDLTGKLPSADEAQAFLQSSEPNKRSALIGRLLDDVAHIDYWSMKWSDILRVKAEFPVKVWPNAAQAYHRWVWESIAQNKRYDQFARELLTSSGSNFRVGPANFYRAIQDRTPEGIAAAVSLAFMGSRIHLWPADRRAGMAVFFTQVGYKPTSEWKEEIVFWDPLNSAAVPLSTAPGLDSIPKAVTATNQIAQALPKPISENGPLSAVFPDGVKVTIPPDRDPREVFADWLIRPENPWFAKAIVDRTWAWVMGRGIIHEPDDIRNDNPPSNPELLAYLEKEFISSGYDLRHLKQLIFTSTTYQFSSLPRFQGAEARANFASYLLRRVEAEVLIDALNSITGSADLYTSAVPEPFTYIPGDMSAVELADGSITSSFLTLFGRSSRSTGMEAERVNELASPQWLHMLNSATLQNKIQNGPKLRALLSASGKPSEIAARLYLTILSRLPTEADTKAVEEYAKIGATKGRDMWIDLAWALFNSPEFLLRH